MSTECSRRTFFRLGLAFGAGIITERVMTPVKMAANDFTEKLTGHPAGNAGIVFMAEEACQNATDKDSCIANYRIPPNEIFKAAVETPLTEELLERTLPSAGLSAAEGRDNFIRDVLVGTADTGIKLSRREVLVGALTATISALIHNIDIKGKKADFNFIPTSQFLGASAYWYLQRKLGIAANSTAHILNNLRAFNY